MLFYIHNLKAVLFHSDKYLGINFALKAIVCILIKLHHLSFG